MKKSFKSGFKPPLGEQPQANKNEKACNQDDDELKHKKQNQVGWLLWTCWAALLGIIYAAYLSVIKKNQV